MDNAPVSTAYELGKKKTKKLNQTLFFMIILAVLAGYAFMYMGLSDFSEKGQAYLMKIRTPRLYAMIISGYCVGLASIAFQSIIKNYIVTPSLLGMESLYSLLITIIYFLFGTDNVFVYNKNLGFIFNLFVMSFVALAMYGHLFKITNYNILYVMLIGTVLSNFFGSFQTYMIRVMDPNTYDSLLDNLVASFGRVNADILMIAAVIVVIVLIVFYKYFKLLDVITLGKEQSINLGVDYNKVVGRLLLAIVLLISVSTALVGPITFLGLIVTNLSRQFFQTYRHFYLINGAAFLSIFILAGGQALIENVLPFTTYISVVVNILGGTYFLFLIIKNKGA